MFTLYVCFITGNLYVLCFLLVLKIWIQWYYFFYISFSQFVFNGTLSTVLTDNIKKIIQDAYSHILESKKVKPRYGQKLMIADIARILGNIDRDDPEQAHICTLEAGTGTGKTIAYLVAALPIAQEQKRSL